MEVKKFSTETHEYAFLKQWLSHDFAHDEEYRIKKARFDQLGRKNDMTEKELSPFMKEVGRARAGVLQHIVRDIFSIPQRKLLDKEIYRRMEGNPTLNFKYILISPISDEIIMAAGALANKTILMLKDSMTLKEENGKVYAADKLKGEILSLIRSNPPHALVREILDGKVGNVVPVEHIIKACQLAYPELPLEFPQNVTF